MRKRWLVTVCLLLIVFAVVQPQPAAQIVYRLARGVAQAMPVTARREWLQIEGEHSLLYYRASDQEAAPVVLADLEDSWARLQSGFLTMPEHIVAFIYPTEEGLQAALGRSGSATLGAYRFGRLYLLSPLAWRSDLLPEQAIAYYLENGPIVHELVHFALDYQVDGNTPLWFSEGLAQYWEWQLKGYLWEVSGSDWLARAVSLPELDSRFGQQGEYAAYRQALAIVRYLYQIHSKTAIDRVVQELGRGQSIRAALQAGVGVSIEQLDLAWRSVVLP